MQLPPLEVLATYPKPNYINPETKGPMLVICNSVLFGISSIIIGIRVYTRVWLSNNFGLDDVFILLAMLLSAILLGASIYFYVVFGGTRHVWDVPPQSIPTMLKFSLFSQIIFGTGVNLVKVSMLLLTRRIMAAHNKVLKHIITGGLIYITASEIAFILVLVFQCSPVSLFWTLSFEPQNCINATAHFLAAGTLNIISDFLVVFIPIPVVLSLQMQTRQRVVVILLFSTGFAVCVVGVVRTILLHLVETSSRDFTWDMQPVFITGSVELYVGIICASVAPAKAFITRYLPKLLKVTTNSFGRSSDNRPSRPVKRDLENGIGLSDTPRRVGIGKPTPNSSIKVDSVFSVTKSERHASVESRPPVPPKEARVIVIRREPQVIRESAETRSQAESVSSLTNLMNKR